VCYKQKCKVVSLNLAHPVELISGLYTRTAVARHPCFSWAFLLLAGTRCVLTLWCPLLPYGYSYKASCASPG